MKESAVTERLLECFRIVFPGVPDEDLITASATSMVKWDSIAQVTLISLIEEELSIQLPLERYAEFTSFSALQEEVSRYVS
jgi:acyl carrier protein